MAKGSKRQKKSGPRTHKPTYHEEKGGFNIEKDLDDEIDVFHKQRDMIPLDINAEDTSDDEIEQPIFNLKDDDEDSDDNEDNDENEVNNDDKDELDHDNHKYNERLTPFERKLARQAKFLKQRIGGIDGDIDDDDDNEPEAERKTVWGRHKSLYFNADNVDFELQSSDEELEAEEAEALRMQREKAQSFSMKDYGLDVSDEDEFSEKEKSSKDVSIKSKSLKKHDDTVYDESVQNYYIKVKKNLNALSKEEQMDVVYSSAPELVGLLSELSEAINHLTKVNHLFHEVMENKNVTEGAIHYLEVKKRLLLGYCQSITFYLLLKSEGHSVLDHPVISRLVEFKSLFEKVKRLDENVPSQIENSIKNNCQNAVGNITNKGNLDANVQSSVAAMAENDSKVAEVQESGKSFEVAANKCQNELELRSKEMLKLRASLEEKLKQKGIYNNLKRKPDRDQTSASKLVNKQFKASDFDDEAAEPVGNSQSRSSKPAKLSELVASKINKRTKFVSGEDDLPSRDDIGERRRKHELRVLARAGAGAMDGGEDDVDDDGEEEANMEVDHEDSGGESEDEFYKEAKRQRALKLSAKAEMHRGVPIHPVEETATDGKRHITYQMEKNKGLTRSRKKLTKIPRKKYKVKHQKAVVRRKGQVRDIRKPTGPTYGGEASGINTNVSRSIRFKN